MQTVRENTTNYLVFPYQDFSPSSLPSGDKIWVLYAYQTLANDTGSYSYVSASVQDSDDRWRTAIANVITSGSATAEEIKLQVGTTYNLELRYTLNQGLTWSTTSTLWGETSRKWGDDSFLGTPHIKVGEDTIFVSGSVSPIQKQYISDNEVIVLLSGSTDMNETVYISPNENGVMKIYQG